MRDIISEKQSLSLTENSHSARSCYTWAAGGPITDDEISHDWQSKED
jgi:hypothetical protein